MILLQEVAFESILTTQFSSSHHTNKQKTSVCNLTNEGRHPLHELAHDKTGIAESLIAYIKRGQLLVCEVSVFSGHIRKSRKWKLEKKIGNDNWKHKMETQPLSCCSPNKIHVLLALVPTHPRTLPTVFWYWLILEVAMVGNTAIVPGA